MSLSNLFLSEILLPVSFENFCCIFFHFETYLSPDSSCMSILCTKDGQRRERLKHLTFLGREERWERPLFLMDPILLKLGCKRGFYFPFTACFPPVWFIHINHVLCVCVVFLFLFFKVTSFICLQQRIISSLYCFTCAGLQRWKQTKVSLNRLLFYWGGESMQELQ